jgi:hypothetical protein
MLGLPFRRLSFDTFSLTDAARKRSRRNYGGRDGPQKGLDVAGLRKGKDTPPVPVRKDDKGFAKHTPPRFRCASRAVGRFTPASSSARYFACIP